MLKRARSLFKRRPPQRPVHRIPDPLVVYAVGDVHGRDDLLERAARAIEEDARTRPQAQHTTIFLGDYVDRGSGSAAVIERLSTGAFPTPVVTLLGNHEQMMLQALEDDEELARWAGFGGLETMFSYEVDIRSLQLGNGVGDTRSAFARALPARHRAWLGNLRPSYEVGDYFFCHAGIRPEVPLAAQAVSDLIWIRDAFTAHKTAHPKMIVHGHTPVREAEIHPNRINIDSGAYLTGTLTVLRLEGEEQRLIPISMRG